MQKLLYSILFFLSFSRSGFSQIYDRSYSLGFYTSPHIIHYAWNDHWMVVGHENEELGQHFTDTIFLLLLDRQGNKTMATRLNTPPSEFHHINDAIPLPDEGFALSIASSPCGVANDITSLYVLNADGSERWILQTNASGPQPLPRRLAVAPDGNLIGIAGCYVQKYDHVTGALLWQSPWNYTAYCYSADFVLEQGTENIVLLKSPGVQYLVQSAGSGTPVYTVAQNFMQNLYTNDITAAPNGWYYTRNFYNDTLVFRFQLNGTQESLYLPNSNLISVKAGPDGLYWLGRQAGNTFLRKTDWALQTIQDVVIVDPYLSGFGLDVHGDTIAIAGVDGSVPGYIPNSFGFKGESLWFHSFWGDTVPSTNQNNVTALELQQTGQLQTDDLSSPGNPYYKISGGNFRLRVKNSGYVPIKQLSLNTIFNTLYLTCVYTPARQKRFDNLDIQPGAEQWLEFGALTDVYQYDLPQDICFWTSSPNAVPDLDHDDDYSCIQLLVSAQEPIQSSLQFFPNPASDGTVVKSGSQTPLSGNYQVYDATGRLVLTNEIPNGGDQFSLPTDTFHAGLYWLKIGNRIGKFEVAR